MTLVSLTDCCHLLAIDPKTLRRWMSLSHLSAKPSPLDARCKCLTREQVQQLALVHRRTLATQERPAFQSETFAFSVPTSAKSAPVLSDVLPDGPALIISLLQQLGSVQAHVATLHHQLTLLTDPWQKEPQWRRSEAETGSCQDKSLESSQDKSLGSCQDKSLESCQDKSLESSQQKESARAEASTTPIDRRKLPHVLPLVEYGAGGRYVVISPEQGLLEFSPDSPQWFAWLSTQISFRFVGQHGHLTVHRNGCSPRWTWRGTRSIRSRSHSLHLVRTQFLTSAVLEQAAASLQALLN